LKDAISTQGTLKWLHFHTTSLQHAKSGALRDAKNSTGSRREKGATNGIGAHGNPYLCN